MKIVIINGSARKGNTLTAINAFIKGASEKNEIEIIEPDKLNIAPCKGCGVCQCSKGCVDKDDTNPTIDKIAAADMILFATPVYWWGMSAQLKLIIDKCYCRGLQLKNKKVGTIVVCRNILADLTVDDCGKWKTAALLRCRCQRRFSARYRAGCAVRRVRTGMEGGIIYDEDFEARKAVRFLRAALPAVCYGRVGGRQRRCGIRC